MQSVQPTTMFKRLIYDIYKRQIPHFRVETTAFAHEDDGKMQCFWPSFINQKAMNGIATGVNGHANSSKPACRDSISTKKDDILNMTK